jgi:hypothetical protein
MNLFLLGLQLAALEFLIVERLYTPYLFISIPYPYVPGPGTFCFIFMFNGSKFKTLNCYRLILTLNIFCSPVKARFPAMACSSDVFIVMRIHSWTWNINFFIKLLLSGNIDFSVMLSTNSKTVNMILCIRTSSSRFSNIKFTSYFIGARRWWF